MIVLNQTIINGQTFESIAEIRDHLFSFAQENLSNNDLNAVDVACLASAVGIWFAYALHKNQQYHQQKIEDAHHELQKRNVLVEQIKDKYTRKLVCSGRPRDMNDPEIRRYINQLYESFYAWHAKDWQLAGVIGVITGIWGFAIVRKVRK